jgi:Glycosyl transferase family 8
MLYISIRFLKYHHPDLKIHLLTDAATFEHIVSHHSDIREITDVIIPVQNYYDGDFVKMSRHLKTSLTDYITGAFVYVDVDAFVVRPIDFLLDMSCDFAACQDGNCDPDQFIMPEFETKPFAALGWTIPDGPYYNSGIMVVRPTNATRDLFSKWHDLWKEASSIGHFKDQPPLNVTTRYVDLNIILLPPQFNFLIGMYRGGAYLPHVVHVSTTNFDQRNDTVFHDLIRSVHSGYTLSNDDVAKISDSGYYWTDRKSIKNVIYSKKWTMLPTAVSGRILKIFER